MNSGVEFVAVDNPHANKLTVHILAAVAEHEREMISERTKAALAAARARGTRLGNPRPANALKLARESLSAAANHRAANILPTIREIQKGGTMTYAGIATVLNARSIKAARGRQWTHVQVANVLGRCRE